MTGNVEFCPVCFSASRMIIYAHTDEDEENLSYKWILVNRATYILSH